MLETGSRLLMFRLLEADAMGMRRLISAWAVCTAWLESNTIIRRRGNQQALRSWQQRRICVGMWMWMCVQDFA